MSVQPRYSGCVFDDCETRIMSDALKMAWHVVGPQDADENDEEISAALRRRIAATILEVAAFGVMDSGTMAQAAIDRERSVELLAM